jgi:hypothetical protein
MLKPTNARKGRKLYYTLTCICWVWYCYLLAQCTAVDHIILINAQEAKTACANKITEEKLHRNNAAIWRVYCVYKYTFIHLQAFVGFVITPNCSVHCCGLFKVES